MERRERGGIDGFGAKGCCRGHGRWVSTVGYSVGFFGTIYCLIGVVKIGVLRSSGSGTGVCCECFWGVGGEASRGFWDVEGV